MQTVGRGERMPAPLALIISFYCVSGVTQAVFRAFLCVAYDEDSVVGEAYRRVARRIGGEVEVPYVAMEPSGFWANVKRWMGLTPAAKGAV